MTRYVLCPRRGKLVPVGKTPPAAEPVLRREAYTGVDGQGVRVYQVPRNHPSILASGVPRDASGRAVVTTAAERDRLIEAFNAHEETRTGNRLSWNREMIDDAD